MVIQKCSHVDLIVVMFMVAVTVVAVAAEPDSQWGHQATTAVLVLRDLLSNGSDGPSGTSFFWLF